MGGWLVFFLLRFDHLNQSSMLVCRLKWDGRKKPSMIPSARVTTCIAGQLEMSYQFRPPQFNLLFMKILESKKIFLVRLEAFRTGFTIGVQMWCALT